MNVYLVIKDQCPPHEVHNVRRILDEFGWNETALCDASLVVVLGGDGTIIGTARQIAPFNIPIVGINFGKLGYLATFSPSSFREYLVYLDAKSRSDDPVPVRFPTSQRMMLHVNGMDMNKEWNNTAVNDCVIDIGPPFRTTEIEIEINGYKFATIRGDGIIIATPTGSTAYNMSAGGPIVQPELQGIAITPKNPHRLSIRPIVVASDAEIKITVLQPEGVHVIIDGQVVFPISTKANITVTKSPSSMRLIQNIDYWSTLTQKLNWGK